jgi:4-amino-4-deoxy-L-arabinose transferase-like glycosyltransferase
MLTSDARAESTSSLPGDARTRVTRRQIITLLAILTCGLGVRLTALINALHSPGYNWQDPDGYMTHAIRLGGRDGWAWTFDAVTYPINGQLHALPPMYSVFLSMFALWPGFPLSAQVAQVGLSVVSIALVFALGRRVHSTRAGLVAASLYALWVPNIVNVWSTSQEALYVPVILTAFLLLARAVDRDDLWPGFALAGVVFGAAALTRSMPMFFAIPAAITHVLLARNRRRASVQGLAFLLGFLLLTAPYSAALSRHFGQLTIIDTHGSIHLESASGARAPSLLETGLGLWRAIRARPREYFTECLTRARSLLHVNGGRILQIYVIADSKVGAVAWKTLVHLGSDAFLVIGAVLAAPGASLCQRPRIAIFLLLWTVLNIGIASVGGFGGARLRAPFEPFLVVLAAVVISGAWRRAHPAALAAAGAAAILAAAVVLPQFPQSLRSWPDYGIVWPSLFDRSVGRFVGAAGLNVPAFDGVATLTATQFGAAAIRLRVRVDGVHVRTLDLAAGETGTIRTLWPRRGLAFIELDHFGSSAERPVIEVRASGR